MRNATQEIQKTSGVRMAYGSDNCPYQVIQNYFAHHSGMIFSMAKLQSLSPRQQLQAGQLPKRFGRLLLGLTLWGMAVAMFVRANLGLDPWNVFHAGLAAHTPLNIGNATIITGACVLLLWIPLREWPGIGTVLDTIWVGTTMNAVLLILPPVEGLLPKIWLWTGALILNGVAGGLYIGAQLGPGARDGLMTSLSRRTGLSLRLVRTVIEGSALIVGWFLGGQVGIGTVAYALFVGPVLQFFLQKLTVALPEPASSADSPGQPRASTTN